MILTYLLGQIIFLLLYYILYMLSLQQAQVKLGFPLFTWKFTSMLTTACAVNALG